MLNWTSALDFGKYKGHSLEWVCDTDPSYLRWALENVKGFAEQIDEKMQEEINSVAEDADYYDDSYALSDLDYDDLYGD